MGWPSTQAMMEYLDKNLARNYPITIDDIRRSELIYGKLTPLLHGKMMRVKPIRIPDMIPLSVPPCLDKFRVIPLYMDIFV